MLVGPPSNPAKLDNQCDISMMFSDLYRAAENGGTDPPVKFLTRFDKSATNIKDSELFIMIGQVGPLLFLSHPFLLLAGHKLSIAFGSRKLKSYTQQ